jgi:hypothetical protein
MSGTLKVINPNGTYFKLRTEQSSDLPPNELYKLRYGQEFKYSFIDPGKFGGHYKVHFAPEISNKYWPNGVQTWFVNPPDVDISGEVADDPLLRRGSKGDKVVYLQKALNKILGLHLKEDGDFGLRTEEAVKKLQKQFGLKPDGEVGPKTWVVIYQQID